MDDSPPKAMLILLVLVPLCLMALSRAPDRTALDYFSYGEFLVHQAVPFSSLYTEYYPFKSPFFYDVFSLFGYQNSIADYFRIQAIVTGLAQVSVFFIFFLIWRLMNGKWSYAPIAFFAALYATGGLITWIYGDRFLFLSLFMLSALAFFIWKRMPLLALATFFLSLQHLTSVEMALFGDLALAACLAALALRRQLTRRHLAYAAAGFVPVFLLLLANGQLLAYAGFAAYQMSVTNSYGIPILSSFNAWIPQTSGLQIYVQFFFQWIALLYAVWRGTDAILKKNPLVAAIAAAAAFVLFYLTPNFFIMFFTSWALLLYIGGMLAYDFMGHEFDGRKAWLLIVFLLAVTMCAIGMGRSDTSHVLPGILFMSFPALSLANIPKYRKAAAFSLLLLFMFSLSYRIGSLPTGKDTTQYVFDSSERVRMEISAWDYNQINGVRQLMKQGNYSSIFFFTDEPLYNYILEADYPLKMPLLYDILNQGMLAEETKRFEDWKPDLVVWEDNATTSYDRIPPAIRYPLLNLEIHDNYHPCLAAGSLQIACRNNATWQNVT